MSWLPTPTIAKMSELRTNQLISCNGWPDSYQEPNAFKPHCKEAISWGCRGKLSPGAKRAWPSYRNHAWGRRMAIRSQRWTKEFGRIIHKLSFQRSPKTILKYNSEFNLLYNHFYSYPITQSVDICLVDGWHNPNTHNNKLWCYSARFFLSWPKLV
jgi:hypothetical protein